MFVIMGATGNTGYQIATGLLAAGLPVRALARDEERLAGLASAGAEVQSCDTSNPATLAGAFRGADAVYTLLPTDRRAPDYRARQREEGEAIVHAVQASGVSRVVALSCVGTDLPDDTGVILGLREQEERLRAIAGIDLLVLRPVSFFENFYDQIDTIRHAGIVADSVEPDLAIPMVGSRDIANAAIRAFSRRDWHGVVVRELLGPRNISYREATRILGAAIGQPDLPYVQLGHDETIAALVEAGLSASFATAYVAMTRAFNEQRVQPVNGRTPANTTPTTFETFASGFAARFEMVAP